MIRKILGQEPPLGRVATRDPKSTQLATTNRRSAPM